jgi:hypothetical protein
MKKKVDSVEMQHRGAEKVRVKLTGMTLDEQTAYWERRGKELRKRKAVLLERRKAS